MTGNSIRPACHHQPIQLHRNLNWCNTTPDVMTPMTPQLHLSKEVTEKKLVAPEYFWNSNSLFCDRKLYSWTLQNPCLSLETSFLPVKWLISIISLVKRKQCLWFRWWVSIFVQTQMRENKKLRVQINHFVLYSVSVVDCNRLHLVSSECFCDFNCLTEE